jgi:hypothetical protein
LAHSFEWLEEANSPQRPSRAKTSDMTQLSFERKIVADVAKITPKE